MQIFKRSQYVLFFTLCSLTAYQNNIDASSSTVDYRNTSAKDNDSFKRLMYKKSQFKKNFGNPAKIEVENVTLECDTTGFPTKDAIKNLMIKQYFSNEMASTIEVDSFYLEANEGIMYIINRIDPNTHLKKAIFFLKISTRFSQKDLTAIQEGDIGRKVVEARYTDSNLAIPKKNLPIIAWIEKFFIYNDPKGDKKIIEITHAAQGLRVFDIITKHPKDIKNCGQAVGKALGSFQQAFMNYDWADVASTWRTVAHGDFHTGNILYNPTTMRVYFIDIATMRSNSKITTDFEYLIFHPYFRRDSSDNEFISKWQLYTDFFVSIFQGYIESFPRNKQAIVAEDLLAYVHSELKHNRMTDSPIFNIFNDKVTLYLKKVLLSDPRLALKYNITPLMQAIILEDTSSVATLLTNGANPNEENMLKDTPLYWAMMTNTSIIPLLYNNGANIDAQDENGATLLHHAIENNNQKAISILLTTGANPNIPDQNGWTALSQAIKINNLPAVDALLSPTVKYTCDINSLDPYVAETPLHLAIRKITYSKFSQEGVNIVKRLLQSPNIDINIKDKGGRSPLALLADNCVSENNQDQYIALAQMLIDAGADINSQDNYQKTPLSNCSSWLAHLNIPYKNFEQLLTHEQNLQRFLIENENTRRQNLERDFIDRKKWMKNQ